MSEGSESRFSFVVLWTGRVVYVATILLIVGFVVAGVVMFLRGELSLFPKQS
jgi:hypothetical protein